MNEYIATALKIVQDNSSIINENIVSVQARCEQNKDNPRRLSIATRELKKWQTAINPTMPENPTNTMLVAAKALISQSHNGLIRQFPSVLYEFTEKLTAKPRRYDYEI